MSKAVGRSLRISPYRQLVIDLMHFSQQVPAVTVERRMDLNPLIAARQACSPKPSWTVLFAKAFGILGRDRPELRRSYLKFPWPRFYEHPHNIVALNVSRELPTENVVIFCLIRGPENRSIAEMEAMVREYTETPVDKLRAYQRSVGVSRIPWPFRRLFWWCALNMFGRRRCHNFGTYSMSSVSSQGAGILHLVPVLSYAIHYGRFDDQGRLEVRLTFDHRIVDGVFMANVLADLESVLNGQIVEELQQRSTAAA